MINRGGEIIGPVEVENEVRKHPDISKCMAWSMPHHDLQECVGKNFQKYFSLYF